MQEHRDFYIQALQIQGQNSFSECLMDFHVNLVHDLLVEAKGDQVLTPKQIHVISHFYAFGLTGVISNWAKNGMKAQPEPVIRMLEKLISGEIFDQMLAAQNGQLADKATEEP